MHVAPMRPDILAVQEVEPITSDMFPEAWRPTYCDRSCAAGFPKRGFGMFSYSQETAVRALDGSEPFLGFRRYEVHREHLSFNVVGVWPWQTSTVKTSYRQAHVELVRHRDWILERPTVLLGDFNANASYRGNNWKDLLELLTSLGLSSAYHRFANQSFGSEKDPTHFHAGDPLCPFHLDYCFVPEAWVPHVVNVGIGTYDDWGKISDHVPVVVDLSL